MAEGGTDDSSLEPGSNRISLRILVTPYTPKTHISVLMLTPQWRFDGYGIATITRSLIKDLRTIDSEGKFIKITCIILAEADGRSLEEQRVEAKELKVELEGYILPRGRKKEPNMDEWMNEGIVNYYNNVLSGTKYDFIIGHVPYLAYGSLNVRDFYSKKKPKVILVNHAVPRTPDGEIEDDALKDWLREADVVMSMEKSVQEKISECIMALGLDSAAHHKTYIPAHPIELFNIKQEERRTPGDNLEISMLTFERKDLEVEGLDFPLGVNAITAAKRETNLNMTLTMFTENCNEAKTWEEEFDKSDRFCKEIPFQTNTSQYTDRLKDSSLFLLPMKSSSPIFGVEALSAIASGVPVLVSKHCGVSSFLLKMKENGDGAQSDVIERLVQESIVTETDVGTWTQRIIDRVRKQIESQPDGSSDSNRTLREFLLFDTNISSSQLEFIKTIVESSCAELELEMNTAAEVSQEGVATARSMGVKLGENPRDPRSYIVALLKHLLLHREKLKKGLLNKRLEKHLETVQWWQGFLSALEKENRKLLDVRSGSVIFTLLCPTEESFSRLEDGIEKLEAMLKEFISDLTNVQSSESTPEDHSKQGTVSDQSDVSRIECQSDVSALILSTNLSTSTRPFDFTSITTVTRSLVNILGQNVKITCAILGIDGNIDRAQIREATARRIKLKGAVLPKGEKTNTPETRWINQLSAAYYHHILKDRQYNFIIGQAPMIPFGAANLKDIFKGERVPKVVLVIHALPKTEQGNVDSDILCSWIKGTDIVFSLGDTEENILKRYVCGKTHGLYIPIHYIEGMTPPEQIKNHTITIMIGNEFDYCYVDLGLAVAASCNAAIMINDKRKEDKVDIQLVLLTEEKETTELRRRVTAILEDNKIPKDLLSLHYLSQESIGKKETQAMETNLFLLPLKKRFPVFGIEALNAALAGVPILVSENSGIAAFLDEIKESEYHVVKREKIETWNNEIEKKLTGGESRKHAKRLREKLLQDSTFTKIHRKLISALAVDTDAKGSSTESEMDSHLHQNTEKGMAQNIGIFFMQCLEKVGRIIGWRRFFWSWRPPVCDIQEPPRDINPSQQWIKVDIPKSKMEHSLVLGATMREVDQQYDGSAELSNQMLVKLSHEICDVSQLMELAILGLDMSPSTVKSQITNHPGDFNEAVHVVLSKWRTSQSNDYDAYKNLCDALVKAKMRNLINKTLK